MTNIILRTPPRRVDKTVGVPFIPPEPNPRREAARIAKVSRPFGRKIR